VDPDCAATPLRSYTIGRLTWTRALSARDHSSEHCCCCCDVVKNATNSNGFFCAHCRRRRAEGRVAWSYTNAHLISIRTQSLVAWPSSEFTVESLDPSHDFNLLPDLLLAKVKSMQLSTLAWMWKIWVSSVYHSHREISMPWLANAAKALSEKVTKLLLTSQFARAGN